VCVAGERAGLDWSRGSVTLMGWRMGLLDWFRRGGGGAPEEPEALREALFEAAARGDGKRFEGLCRARREVIAANFPAWHTVPEPIRGDRQAVQRYVEGLMAVGRAFEHFFGDGSLMAKLIGPREDNPVTRWQDGLARAQALMEGLQFAEAKEVLTDLLIDIRDLQAFGPVCLPAMTHGVLGHCLFGMGDVDGARTHYERALQLCEAYGDDEGVRVYLGSLHEVHRYLGRWAEAAAYGERFALALRGAGREDEAAEWERRAARVRAGEPLNRVVAVMGAARYEIDEVPALPPNCKVQGVFVRNRPSLKLCEGLTAEGGRLGGAAKFYEALESFRAAARVDPYDPQPRYEGGITLMHLGQFAEAAGEFAATDELAPGWYRCRTERWLAEEIAAGRVESSVFLVLRLEDFDPASMPAAERLGIVEQALARSPEVAPLHLLRAQILLAEGREGDSAAACRAGLKCAREDDVRTRLLVQLHLVESSKEERGRLLREAVGLRDTGNLLAASLAAIVLKTLEG
jgi:tetratricopeptide (TPR) repeat protein